MKIGFSWLSIESRDGVVTKFDINISFVKKIDQNGIYIFRSKYAE
jgi:hypothetical protein